MPLDFEKVRDIVRQLAKMAEDMWIERESMKITLHQVCGFPKETIEESLAIAKKSEEMRAEAHQAFSGMWKALEDASFEIVAEELMKDPPSNDKPN
jgi:hypothetical protein